MTDDVNDRKLDHVRILREDAETDRRHHYFDDVKLRHRALPELDLRNVDPGVTFMGKRLSFPLLISCMTGGDHDMLRTVNRNLALAAESGGVAMGVGSQRVMFTTPGARSSFALREHAPTALLFANLGAVQLNYGVTADMCAEAVDIAGADGLYMHLNPLQEAVQPEGNTNFAGLADAIGAIAGSVSVPVIAKEVGAGISRIDAQLLADRGIHYVDVAGSGGTSWSRVESHRRDSGESRSLGRLFQDWGIPTPTALRELAPLRDRVTLVASGGIRNGVDMAKAMVLGASLCGIARPFLEPAIDSVDAVVAVIERLQHEFTTAMFLLGAATTGELFGNQELLLQ